MSRPRCTRYVVVPECQISDTTTFGLEPVPAGSEAETMFKSAIAGTRPNLWLALYTTVYVFDCVFLLIVVSRQIDLGM